ncbi:MAG: MmcQ/YjbR family DNA-binding protein [Candidatus Neomarinimicrobiota bacterium]
MKIEKLKKVLLNKLGTTEETPFGPGTMVYKVGGKMFALFGLKRDPIWLNLKCDPELALVLRLNHSAVIPGYHMNKEHWNTVILDDSIPESEVQKMIDHSYALIVKSLPKNQQNQILHAG